MLGAVRRYGVAHALRASLPRSSVRAIPQLLKWQPSPASRLPSAARLIHNAPPTRSSASAAFQEDVPAQSEEPLREFADLAKQGLVDPTVINTISRMGISTMTDVQSRTLRETLKGDDVYVFSSNLSNQLTHSVWPRPKQELERHSPSSSRLCRVS